MAPSLPLPKNFFPCPLLNAMETEYLMDDARSNSIDVIARTTVTDDSNGPIKWTLDCQDGEQKIYRGDDWDAPQGVQSFLGVFELRATLEEVAALYACDTDTAMTEFRRTVAQNVLDLQQLYVLSAPTDDNPRHFIGVKWAALESPGLVRHRDWVLLESHHDFEWEGRRGWARTTKSIDLPFMPASLDEFNFVRGFQLRSGFVFMEQPHKPGYVEAVQLHQFDLMGKVPSWLVSLGIKKRCRAFLDLAKYVRENRLAKSAATFVPTHRWVSKDLRTHCHGCRKRFLPLVHVKSHCRSCGEVFCNNCSKHWTIKKSTVSKDGERCNDDDKGGAVRGVVPSTRNAAKLKLHQSCERIRLCTTCAITNSKSDCLDTRTNAPTYLFSTEHRAHVSSGRRDSRSSSSRDLHNTARTSHRHRDSTHLRATRSMHASYSSESFFERPDMGVLVDSTRRDRSDLIPLPTPDLSIDEEMRLSE